MKHSRLFLVASAALILSLVFSCKPPSSPAEKKAPPSRDEAQKMSGQGSPTMPQGMPPSGGMSGKPQGDFKSGHETVMPDDVKKAYTGVQIRVEKKAGGEPKMFDVPFNKPTPLGDTGLIIEIIAYMPNFFMDQTRISSIGTEPINPACKYTVKEDGKEDYSGWLFAKMPEVHPFPHDVYKISLSAGIKAAK